MSQPGKATIRNILLYKLSQSRSFSQCHSELFGDTNIKISDLIISWNAGIFSKWFPGTKCLPCYVGKIIFVYRLRLFSDAFHQSAFWWDNVDPPLTEIQDNIKSRKCIKMYGKNRAYVWLANYNSDYEGKNDSYCCRCIKKDIKSQAPRILWRLFRWLSARLQELHC